MMGRRWRNNIYWWTWLLLLLHLCSFVSAHTVIAEEQSSDWIHYTKVRLCNSECHYLSALDVRGGERKKKIKITWNCQFVLRIFEAIYEMQGESFGIQDLYVFFTSVCLRVWGKNNTWDVFDFDTLKTSVRVFVTSDLLPLCRWKWKINWAEDRSEESCPGSRSHRQI